MKTTQKTTTCYTEFVGQVCPTYTIKQKSILAAFTLAEVLIAIAVIGVAAAMTIPTVIVNINEHKNMTMLKKLYASYSINIQSMLSSEYGTHCDSLSCLRKWGNPPDADHTAPYHNKALADPRYFCFRNLSDFFCPIYILPFILFICLYI